VVFEAVAVVVLEFEAEMVLLAVGAVMEEDDPAQPAGNHASASGVVCCSWMAGGAGSWS
jgi:hypothetical protein